MITEEVGRHKVVLYATIDELPIDRFTAWNKYMMIDGALGGTFEDIDRLHLSQLSAIVDQREKALQQIQNLRELVFNVIKGFNYAHHAYACMVHSIDGKECDDISDTGIKTTLEHLAKIGLTNRDVKKKTKNTNWFYSMLLNIYSRSSSIVRGKIPIGLR